MINLKQLSERYPKGFGFGGHGFYEINSQLGINLNSYGQGKWILNSDNQVECYDVLLCEIKSYWGKTLDNYYLWPWFPEKEIKAFTVVRNLPEFDLDEYCECDEDGIIRSSEDWETSYSTEQCLKYPEFFKPHYK